jgi:hypothetical protein
MDPSLAAALDAIERQVVDIRGLESTVALDREVIDEARLVELSTQSFDEDNPPAYTAAYERMFKALGLIPQDMDLRATTLEMIGAGVAGFYRPDEKKMYIVSRSEGFGAEDKVTYAHEFTHALQDQHWPVFTEMDGVLDRSDWVLARQGVYEGDATTLMFQWALANMTQAEIGEILAGSADPEQQAIIDGLPAIMRESLVYPYTTGAFFVQGVQAGGGWDAVDDMYDHLPTSTEQIIHPETYTADQQPLDIQLPATLAADLGAGWSVPLQDTFGEFQTAIWLREGLAAAPEEASTGWGGDRLAMIEGPDGAWALAWHTAWDTAEDAADFETAATTALAKAGGVAQLVPGEGGVHRWVLIADKAATLDHVASVLGLAG